MNTCTVSVIYDQSGQGNHLRQAPPDCYLDTLDEPSNESDAKRRAIEVSGPRAYALQMIAHDGYRVNDTSGMPKGTEPQGIYEVVDGKRFGSGCCLGLRQWLEEPLRQPRPHFECPLLRHRLLGHRGGRRLKTVESGYTLRVGNAQPGELTTAYDGPAPIAFQMQGAVILGLGSDASDASYGTFFEGAITSGRPSDAVDRAVLRSVQAAGYGR